jgi:Tol biopolymer transport system component
VVWVDRQGHEEPIPVPAAAYTVPRLSPDGVRLALDVRGQENHVWIWDFARQTSTRFSINRDGESYPVWTADGQRLVFSSDTPTPAGLFWQAADGTGMAERLWTTPEYVFLSAVSRDSSWVVFTGGGDLMALSLRGDRQVRPLVQTPYLEINGDLSPDGRWLAYQSDESGQFEIYVRPFPDVNAGRWKVSTGGGARPLWSRNGAELFYLTGARYPGPSGALMSVRVKRETTWTADPPTKLFDGDYVSPVVGRTYDASANGQRFVMIKPTDEAAHPSVIVVQNWDQELKRLVPTR